MCFGCSKKNHLIETVLLSTYNIGFGGLCMQAAKALLSLHGCTGSLEAVLLAPCTIVMCFELHLCYYY